MDFAQASAKNGEILRVDINKTAFNCAPASNDRVAHDLLLVESKVIRAMNDEWIHFAERAFV